MALAKTKDSIEGKNIFCAVFLYDQNKDCTFVERKTLCYKEGQRRYARAKILDNDG